MSNGQVIPQFSSRQRVIQANNLQCTPEFFRFITSLAAAVSNFQSSSASILNGAGIPSASLGAINDFYINTRNYTIYGPKTSNGWGAATSLIGKPGTNGTSAPSGGSSRSFAFFAG